MRLSFVSSVVLCLISLILTPASVRADIAKDATDLEFFTVIAQKESEGQKDPNSAVGDTDLRDHAYGRLGIRQPYCDDVNRVFHTNYEAKKCSGDLVYSIRIVLDYMSIYCTEQKLGHKPTAEDAAGIHNGGPNGWRKSSTLEYRADFTRKLNKLRMEKKK